MRKTRKIVACLVAVLMVLSACSAAFTASAVAATSGTCGNNATWVIENGTLTISGDGAMYDYNFDAPWGDGSGMRYYSNIVINPGITYIGSRAFYDSKATSVSIPNTVTVLGDGAFHWSSLTSVTIPGSVTSWTNAFNLCHNLMNVTVEYGVTTIDNACFGGCSNLSSVNLPDSVTSIEQGAFVGCTSLTSINLPNNLISIGDGAFQNTGLTTVSLPISVNTVGVSAFSDSTLTSITLSPAMSVIQEGMFNNCSSLESVSIPASVTAIEQYAFNACPSLDRVYYGGTQQQWDAITIGEGNHALDDARVVCSDTPAYLPYCGNNAMWSIENGVLSISGRGAMYDYGAAPYFVPDWAYQSFTGVEVGDNITTIGAQAFQQITTITSLVTFNALESIGDNAFCGCTGLTNTVFANNLRSIGDLAFSNCDGLTSFYIPDSVWSLGDYAFRQCDNLTTLTIGVSATELGYGTFQECPALTTINYNAVNAMDLASDNYLFAGVPNANTPVTVNIGSDVWYIPANLFRLDAPGYGPAITTVNIPVGLSAIGAGAFKNCTTVSDVYYSGTKQQWNALNIGADNDPLTNAAIHCSDGTILPANACGEHARWSIANGVLTISGSGDMYDYEPGSLDAPWALSDQSYSSIVIEPGITRIGEWAFGPSPATSVSIPNTVTSIGTGAFSGSSLTSVTIPGSVQSWQESFIQCNSLTTVTIQYGVEVIDIMSFGGCANLTTVTIPDSVTAIGNCAFQMCSSLTSITLPANLQSIGDGAFSQSGLTAIQLPNTVTTLGDCAFGATALTEIVLPSNLTVIPYNLLSGCAQLTDVTIPDGVTTISDSAFSDCTALTSIHIPASVQTIGYGVFDGCTNLSYICSPVANGAAEQYAIANYISFQFCGTPANACGDHLTWSIDNGVLTISGAGDMYDFCNPNVDGALTPPWEDEYYTEVVIGYGVTSIGSDAFVSTGISNLTTVTIPDTVTSIGDEAFLFCESLSGVVIPNSVTTIGERAFLQCTGMSTLTLGSGVTEIKIGAFASCSSLTSLVIPDNVEIIGVSAFGGCSGLTSLTIGSGVTSLGATAFEGCDALTEINYNIPNLADLTDEHGLFAFEFDQNTNVTVTFGSGVQRIPAYLFWIGMPGYGPNIKTVNIPSSVTSVGHDAFNNCTTITDVNYGGTQQQWDAITIGSNNDPLQNATKNFVVSGTCYENLTWAYDPYTRTLTISGTGEIKESPWASYGSSVKTLVVNSGVTGICDFAFSGCTGLTNVTLPDSVASIGDHAFNDTAYYKDQSNWQNGVLYINNHVIKANQFHANGAYVIRPGTKTIAYSAFYGCSGLTSVTIPNSVTSICDNAFMSCVGLTELTIPDGVTSIRRAAFSLCRGLTSVTIPDGVTSIGELAFSRCTGLTSVTIPDSVTSIDRGVFYYCGALADVYFDGTQQQWNGITISTDMNDPLFAATIHCSDGTIGEAPNDEYSVSVNDQVALNLMLDLEARGVTTDAVTVTLNGQPCEYDVVQDGDQYRFSIVTAPAQLADPIVVIVDGETIATTSVMDYCVALCGHEYDEYPEAQALARALLQYGKAANAVFDYSDAEITTFGALDTAPVAAYTGAKFNDGTHKVTGASFLALTKPEFRFYMNNVTEAEAYAYNQAGVTAAYVDSTVGEELHARFVKRQVNGETLILVEVTGVSVENMEELIVVTIPGLGNIYFNGNVFAKAMANDGDAETQALGAALYNYGVAAHACFKEDQP